MKVPFPGFFNEGARGYEVSNSMEPNLLMNVHSFECKVIRTLTELGVEDQLYNYDIVILDTIFNWIAPLDFIFQLQEIIFHKNLIIFTNMGQEKIANHIRLVNKVKGSFAIPFNLDHREAVK